MTPSLGGKGAHSASNTAMPSALLASAPVPTGTTVILSKHEGEIAPPACKVDQTASYCPLGDGVDVRYSHVVGTAEEEGQSHQTTLPSPIRASAMIATRNSSLVNLIMSLAHPRLEICHLRSESFAAHIEDTRWQTQLIGIRAASIQLDANRALS